MRLCLLSPMFKTRICYKKIFIWIVIFIQIVLIVSYFYMQVNEGIHINHKISFVTSSKLQVLKEKQPNYTYHIEKDTIYLKNLKVREKYIDFNSSLCYKNGTDLNFMNRSKNLNWHCQCVKGYHGKDCGQPEVIWRALLTQKKPMNIKGPRLYQRHVIYIFLFNEYFENLVDIRINELGDVVDLFIIFQNEKYGNFEKLLATKFIKNYHDKILYIKGDVSEHTWSTIKTSVNELKDDDIILISETNDVPNKYVISFLKYYDNWPQPLRFRLRWSVFGFFWRHPTKTKIKGWASTVHYMQETTNNNLKLLLAKSALPNAGYNQVILGDLNHFGGWYCEYCMDASRIIDYLNSKPSDKLINWQQIGKPKIDNDYIEDLIENGLYIDGKLELQRSRKYQDSYFAPSYVTTNNWKFDYLLVNLYSKLDYYEG